MGKNSETVMGLYEAFGRGDVEHILGQMRDDIAFDHGIRQTEVPYLSAGTGKDHVVSFFTSLAENLEFTAFEPGAPCESGDTVMVPIREASRNLKTGATIDEDVYVHIWTFDADGKIASMRHVGDFARHEAAAKALASAG